MGRGIFKSMDGGDTWVHQGLENSERIHRIVLDPTNPNVAYAGVMGPAWSDGQERGVYRTTDGGATWERVLFVNERTGASDLVMDPSNPNKLFAGMWEHRRWPWFFESGGEGSGLYVTYDGGDTWTRITDDAGIPEGPLGRIGLAIARNNPNVVYAVVEATRSELIRSSDGGRSWETISDRRGVVNRPFYYADIRVDPENENRIYNLHSQIQVSEDQGRTFRTVVPSSKIHGDVQELWIHPEDGRRLIMGNDGGIGISYDRGATWRFVANLPIAQFYQINVDMERPYNVYGGMQDNGSWFGPSSVWHTGGIRNYDWMRVGGGDGFATMTDFSNTRYGYTESQQGFIRRFDKVTGERRDIRPVHPEGIPLRFNWNAALNVDPFDSTTIYLGSQFVHRSDDHGNSWEIISPDLTTNDPEKQRSYESGGLSRDASGAENHTAIMTIAPSPVEQGVIWVGTDDGNVQVTRDGGETWTNVIDRIRGVPNATWVAHIEPSKFDGATAFVVFDDHRRGNWESYVFKTTDYGNRWTNIATDDIDGFVHVIEQDPVAENLLFVGTEFGLFVSSNGGGSWFKWTHGVPTVPVRAAIVHPRDRDLVLGTHGRAAFVLDDIGPLREMALDPSIQNRALHAFEILDAQQHVVAEPMGYRSTGDAMFFGENREYGAMISYWRNTEGGDVDIVISATGDTIARLNGTTERGLNRITWDLRADGFRRPTPNGASEPGRGPEVYPFGDFTVTIRDGNETATAELAILADPRVEFTAREQESTLEGLVMIGQLLDQLAGAVEAVNEYNEAIGLVVKALEERGTEEAEALATQGRTLMDNLTEAAKK
ncbi:MAG: hypothetical protein OEZ54_11265, partial [Gemmatimonadota bacterium]|nr:hypothetical protein [Gemmatimonadota bacterium]